MNTIVQEVTERTVKRGSLLYAENSEVKEIVVLKKGHMITMNKHGRSEVKQGSVIGLVEGMYGKYIRNYIVDADSVLQVYPLYRLTFVEQFETLPLERMQLGALVDSTVEQVLLFIESYNEKIAQAEQFYNYIQDSASVYSKLCKAYGVPPKKDTQIKEMPSYQAEGVHAEEYLEYFEHLMEMPLEVKKPFFAASPYMSKLMLQQAIALMEEVVDLQQDIQQYVERYQDVVIGEEQDALFPLYEDLILYLSQKHRNITVLKKKADEILNFASTYEAVDKAKLARVKQSYQRKLELFENQDVAEEITDEELQAAGEYTAVQLEVVRRHTTDTTEKLIEYAGMPEDKNEALRQSLIAYGNMTDWMSTTDEARKIRRKLSELFYEYYEAVFFKYYEDSEKNPIVEMFLNYGFMDEHLVPDKMIADLFYAKLEPYEGEYAVYTMREWMTVIYEGKAEPSKNEFELDYEGNLREMKKTQSISPEQEKAYRADQKGKVRFELKNMLTSANRLTQGQILSFCPVLHLKEGEESPIKSILQKAQVVSAIEQLKKIDFSCFYRPIVFWDTEHGIKKEIIEKQVYPIIILMPNIGSNGLMWQEVSGAKKDTPARFAFPLFTREDLVKMIVPVLGQFRWELCRNVQGVYWNDLQEKSLTSEYFDYAQFFKKNRDLSVQAKDRIKQQLQKARNSFRNMFVQDYTDWIMFESNGSSRLNKVSREILAVYCPFAVEYRSKLAMNPSYAPGLERYERIRRDKKRRVELMENTLRKNKGTVTQELEDYANYLDK